MAEFSNPAAFFRMRLVTPKGLGRTLLFSVFGCLAVSNALAENFAAVPLQQETAIEFATHETGAAIMGTQDQFVQCMTPIDRQLRLASNQPVEVADYLKFVSEQVLEWRAEEVQKVSQAIESLQPRFAQLRPLWPAKVVLIKTTGREENQAPHCRGNAIVLPEKSLRQTRDAMEHLLTHELFHVLSRQSQERQTQLYAILGFQRCQPIQLPESLALRKLTNPDAPDIDCVLQLKHQDMDISVSPLLITKSPSYDSLDNRTVFSELSFQLLQVRATPAGWVADNASNPTLLDPALAPDFHRQIGRNTAYILHPEETLADNFVHMVFRTKGLPDPWIVEKLRIQLDR